jgi:hypothetical protein
VLAAREGLPAVEDIAHIEVISYSHAAELSDPAPANTLAAKFSVPFAVATRLVHGHSGLTSFTWDAVRDERVLALARKVSISEDPAMTQRLPLERPARVVISLHDGRQIIGEAGVNRGDDAAPYSREELRQKFMDLTQRVWPAAHAAAVLEATLEMAALRGNPGELGGPARACAASHLSSLVAGRSAQRVVSAHVDEDLGKEAVLHTKEVAVVLDHFLAFMGDVLHPEAAGDTLCRHIGHMVKVTVPDLGVTSVEPLEHAGYFSVAA